MTSLRDPRVVSEPEPETRRDDGKGEEDDKGKDQDKDQASTYRALPCPHLQCVGMAYVMRKMRSGSDR